MTKSPSSGQRPESQTSQSERFIETARELGCDEDEAAFDEKLKRIATAKPMRTPKTNEALPRPKNRKS
jgi:hypothetical protein